MILGLIGRGPWANQYAATLRRMGVDFLQSGREWQGLAQLVSGVIVASAAESHAEIARDLIERGAPCLIEKPLCLTAADAQGLLTLAQDGGIVFTGHTRLYSKAWRAFKVRALKDGVQSFYGTAGSADCKVSPALDWGSHLVAMCMDLGYDPLNAHILTSAEHEPLKVTVNGTMTYTDVVEEPRPLEVLLTEFMAAIEKGEPDIRGLELGVKVIEAIEAREARETAVAQSA